MKILSKIFFFWVPVILWAGIIFLFSSYPTAPTSEIYWQDFIVKKLAHVIEYGIFAGLLYRAFKKEGVGRRNAALVSILLALLYGSTDEFHQSFTPGREPRARDVIFDTIGAILSIYTIWNLLPKAPKKLRILATKLELL